MCTTVISLMQIGTRRKKAEGLENGALAIGTDHLNSFYNLFKVNIKRNMHWGWDQLISLFS